MGVNDGCVGKTSGPEQPLKPQFSTETKEGGNFVQETKGTPQFASEGKAKVQFTSETKAPAIFQKETKTPNSSPFLTPTKIPTIVTIEPKDEGLKFSTGVFTPVPRPGIREFQHEFEVLGHQLSDSSTKIRPDAVSSSHLVTTSAGPKAIADVTEGAISRAWKARVSYDPTTDTSTVFITRENETKDNWQPETVSFSFSGQTQEMDLGFEQAARPVIAMQRGDEIWVYWFDPFLADFTLTNFGEGRTPRVLLDNPLDTTDSDVLIFYMSNIANGLVYRQQRDRYEIEFVTPIVDTQDMFVEEVIKTRDNRVAIIMSKRDKVLGRYSFVRMESTLYPYIEPPEELDYNVSLLNASLIEAVINQFVTEELDYDVSFLSGELRLAVIFYNEPPEELDYDVSLLSGNLVLVVITYTEPPEELDYPSPTFINGTLVLVVIVHNPVPEELDYAVTLLGGSLEPA